MNTFKTVLAIAVTSLFAGTALAQSNYEIEQRDRAQQERINRGLQSGQLTSREADRLQGERAQIERLEQRARSDGTLTRNERARIDNAQDRLGRDIRRESNDRQTANGNRGHWDNRGDNRGNHNGWDNRGDNRGNHNGWDNRGDNRGNHNGWGRGNERGNEHGARGQGNVPHSNGWTPRTETGTHTSMPQAQVRSTQDRGSRPVAVASQGSSGGRRTR